MGALARVAVAALLSASPVGAAPALPDDIVPRLGALVEEQRRRGGIPALSVAVFTTRAVVAELTAGFADREGEVLATVDTVYPAASVSKLLTAALVMRQVERGALALDAPANRYLEPRHRIRSGDGTRVDATSRQLLCHASGLPVSWSGIGFDPDQAAPTPGAHLARGLVIVRPPGERIIYSNDGFALLGWLAGVAAGKDFAAHAREVLLEPLGMTSSSFAPGPELRGRLAAAYGGMGGGDDRVEHADVSAIAAAGGLVTTAGDLARFGRLMLNRGELDGLRLLAGESVDSMMRLHARQHPELAEGFGLGFAVREGPGRRMVWWDGGLPGAAARLALLPDHGVGVAILSNLAGNGPVNVLSRRIFDLLLGPDGVPRAHITDEAMEAVTGAYRPIHMVDPQSWFLEPLLNVVVERSESGLRMRLPAIDDSSSLEPIGPRRFLVAGGMFDGAVAYFEADRLYAHAIEARRLAPWETATAVIAYGALLVLTLVAIPALFVARTIRRRRRARAGGSP